MTQPHLEPKSTPRRALGMAAGLNVLLSAGLGVAGLLADSSGLLASALDNTSDAAVYVISYYALDHGAAWKTRAARLSGVMLLVLCAAFWPTSPAASCRWQSRSAPS